MSGAAMIEAALRTQAPMIRLEYERRVAVLHHELGVEASLAVAAAARQLHLVSHRQLRRAG